MEDLIFRIGKLVKEKHLEMGYSTQELAEELYVSAGLINNIKNRNIDIFNLTPMEKFCSILSIYVISLLAAKSEDISKLLNISSHDIPGNLSKQIDKLTEEYSSY